MPLLSQSQLAHAWGPPCKGVKIEVDLNGTGTVSVRASIADGVLALDACLREYRYQTIRSQTGAFACRHKVGASGWSNHSYATALDINWLRNPQGTHRTDMPAPMRAAIKAIRTNSGVQVWAWGGDWTGLPDPMHWEIACAPRDIASGINPATVPDGWPGPPVVVPPPATPSRPPAQTPPADTLEEDEPMYLVKRIYTPAQEVFLSRGAYLTHLTGDEWRYYRDDRHLGPTTVEVNATSWAIECGTHEGNGDAVKLAYP